MRNVTIMAQTLAPCCHTCVCIHFIYRDSALSWMVDLLHNVTVLLLLLEDGCNRDAQCDDYDAPLVTNLFGQRFCCKNNRNTAALIFSLNDDNQVECQCAL